MPYILHAHESYTASSATEEQKTTYKQLLDMVEALNTGELQSAVLPLMYKDGKPVFSLEIVQDN